MSNPFEGVVARYHELLDVHGPGLQALDYNDAAAQLRRFEVLSEALPDAGAVLDVGCGLADFADFLRDTDREVRYVGIDLSERLITHARERRPDLDLRVGNILDADLTPESFDLVVANGIFYLLGDDAFMLMAQIVDRMFSLASAAVAFTTLSAWGPEREAGEFYADPVATLEMCHALTPWLTFRHDYHWRDFAVYLYRHGPR